MKALSESIASVQGGCVGKDGYDEILASTYSGKLHIIYSIHVAYGDDKYEAGYIVSEAHTSTFCPDWSQDNVLLKGSVLI